ncbi:hypothetical protein [Streptomyces sp. MMBL 11-3]
MHRLRGAQLRGKKEVDVEVLRRRAGGRLRPGRSSSTSRTDCR